jgi:glycosyltransferase involved in cell wall biosynthesis
MRILHVETGMNLYGGARQVQWLLDGLTARGVAGRLVCPLGSAISEEIFAPGLAVAPVPMGGDLDVGFIGRLRAEIRRWGPDLVHLHSRRGADVLGAIAARRSRVPVVLSRRVTNPEPAVLAPLKYRLYDRVITISAAIAEGLVAAGVDRGKIRIVHSTVPPHGPAAPWERGRFERAFGLAPAHCVVGMAAQFIERKGHGILLDAVPRLIEARPELRFLLVGQGPLGAAIAQRIRDDGLGDHVLLPGFRPDLADFIGCFDLLVHPALDEGLGVVLLEASAAGVPIVAARAGGIPEAVRDGVNGLLVPPADAAALVEAVLRLAVSPALRAELGAGGRRLMDEEFSVDGMVDGNLAVYKELL